MRHTSRFPNKPWEIMKLNYVSLLFHEPRSGFMEQKHGSREVRDLVSGTRQGVDTKHLRVCFDTFATKKADTGFVTGRETKKTRQ